MTTPRYVLASIESEGDPVSVIVHDDTVYELPGGPSMRAVLDDWQGWTEQIESAISSGRLGRGVPVAEVRFAAPLPEPRNLYMAGANYADHAREMRGLPRDAPITPPVQGPFFFLKPTSTVVGPDSAVVLPNGIDRLDWEVELAAIIGTPARNMSEESALDCVAGYTVINDVSARDRFKREPAPEPPMTFDWFSQKGWATTCPMGPWLVPSQFCADPGALRMTLRVNDVVKQNSSTAEMIFDLKAQIAFLSRVVELLPGDVIATGTPAGVGAGDKNSRYLQPGDEMAAEVEGIGTLRNRIEREHVSAVG
ncbi:fumarylacetoacetate hydrolase family protein [Streptomyces sp. NPDC029041]|uniref:fumarylacetoacetate hydrolase family protein n=1 Tax=Streptomyces sp. NPDC029041 TaxID=3155727 RepID=UPI0033FD5A1D